MVSDATRLRLYNGALQICGSRLLASLTQNSESRRLLDFHWDDGALDDCLALAAWNFAIRTEQVDPDPAIEPEFGYRYGYPKPEDWIRFTGLAEDEHFIVPLLRFEDEADHLWTDISPIYWSYVSGDSSYGYNEAAWPESFADVVKHHLALKIAPRVTQSDQKVQLISKDYEKVLKLAKTQDAISEPTRFPAQGSWSRARRGGRAGDRGKRSTLIG